MVRVQQKIMKHNPFENFKNLGSLDHLSEEHEYVSETDGKDILEEDEKKPSFSTFYVICSIVAVVFLFRLLDLQVAQGAKFQYLAEGNRIRSRDVPAPRGIIYDRNGKMLAKNAASFNLELYPADLPQNKSERMEVYKKIEEISAIPASDTEKKVEKEGLFSVEPIVLTENINREDALPLIVKYNGISGVEVSARPNRAYDTIPGLSHFIGYIGKVSQDDLNKNPDRKLTDWIGKVGLELTYENELKGSSGKEQIEVDSRGRIQRSLASLDPKPGNNLYLGINLDLQSEMAKDLGDTLKELNLTSGVVLAMDPRDGSMLGMVSLPSYDNNLFTKNIAGEYKKLLDDPAKPMVNRAISGLYPSGSTIKPFVASAGLQEKVISENTTINDSGEIKVGDWVFPDWKAHGHTDVRKAIAESCDVFFYAVGGGWDKISGLGVERLDKYLGLFGFGEKTGIDLSGEEGGLIPTPEWKKKVKKESWYLGDSYHLSIGQGDFLSTPLQVLGATSAIANGGELLTPHLTTKITDHDGNTIKEIGKEVIRKDFIDSDNINIVREGMRQTITSGSGKLLNDLPFEVAGKTGTAQFNNNEKNHAWFTAFAPYDNPEIALVVLVEGGGEGNEVAIPVAKKILEWYMSHK